MKPTEVAAFLKLLRYALPVSKLWGMSGNKSFRLSLAFCTLLSYGHVNEVKGYSVQQIYYFTNSYPAPTDLTLGTDGAFYGTSSTGGDSGNGFIFKVTTNGIITTVASFTGNNGAMPSRSLVLASDGALYGTTSLGGAFSRGTVFRVTNMGVLTTLISFTGSTGPYIGDTPTGLGLGKDGALYGCTYVGPFRLTIDGQFSSLGTFNSATTGVFPTTGLTQGPDDAFYGTTIINGPLGYGTVFRVTQSGALTAIAAFDRTNSGMNPQAKLLLGFDGALYGTTISGGTNNGGTIFKCTTNGTLTTLYHFAVEAGGNGYNPKAGLVQRDDGVLYGVATAGGNPSMPSGTVFRVTTDGTVTRLLAFSQTNGWAPISTLIFGPGGRLYGTTAAGGIANAGTVFQITIDGTLTTLASFRPAGGVGPKTSVTQGPDGTLYGTTDRGGSNGLGTIFGLSLSGTLTLSIPFDGINGATPSSPPILGADGNLYGLTFGGGHYGYGTFYRATTNGLLTALMSFDETNGVWPMGPLCLGNDGAFYGTTKAGQGPVSGTVFRVTTNGDLTTLAPFDAPHGAYPQNGVIQGADGAFYGTTDGGGTYNAGVVFRVSSNGLLTTLASFNPGANLGQYGDGTLVQTRDGTLYGTTSSGGSGGFGTVFKLTTNGTFSIIKPLQNADPHSPSGPIVLGPDGAIYGTANGGGAFQQGGLFRISTNGSLTTLISFGGNVLQGFGPSGLFLGAGNRLYGTGGGVFSVDLSSYFLGPPVKQATSRVLSFSVIPAAVYFVQRATDLNGSWTNIATVGGAATLSGTGQYTDTAPPWPGAFYRLMLR